MNYTPLSNGTGSGSNWTLTGLSLSTGQNFYIRARGYYRSGEYNGSESITESVRNAFNTAGPDANTYTYTYTYTYTHADTFTHPNTHSYCHGYTDSDGYADTDQYIWHYLLLLESSPWPSAKCNAHPNWYYVGLNIVRRLR